MFVSIVANRIKNAYRGMSWLVLRRNIAGSAAGFTVLSFVNDVLQVLGGRMSPGLLLLSPFLNFALFCLFFFLVGVPYYFLRNLILPSKETP
jgi:hypothetical protein